MPEKEGDKGRVGNDDNRFGLRRQGGQKVYPRPTIPGVQVRDGRLGHAFRKQRESLSRAEEVPVVAASSRLY